MKIFVLSTSFFFLSALSLALFFLMLSGEVEASLDELVSLEQLELQSLLLLPESVKLNFLLVSRGVEVFVEANLLFDGGLFSSAILEKDFLRLGAWWPSLRVPFFLNLGCLDFLQVDGERPKVDLDLILLTDGDLTRVDLDLLLLLLGGLGLEYGDLSPNLSLIELLEDLEPSLSLAGVLVLILLLAGRSSEDDSLDLLACGA